MSKKRIFAVVTMFVVAMFVVRMVKTRR